MAPDKVCAAIERVADRRHARMVPLVGEAVAAERVCDWLTKMYAEDHVYEVPRRRAFVRELRAAYAAKLGRTS